MTGWDALDSELDRWADTGHKATFWWRDDDAADAGVALDRLLGIGDDTGTPLALAVIPARATGGLAARVGAAGATAILQHGFSHENYEAGPRKAELGDARPADDVVEQLTRGRSIIAELFADPLAVLVPPWNRISPALLPRLADIGFTGLSDFRSRQSRFAAPGVVAVNTHIDIIDWKGSRAYCGDPSALDAAVSHLAARRTGACDGDEPTGLLTHHLAHDRECWDFVELFIKRTSDHKATHWLAGATVFGTG